MVIQDPWQIAGSFLEVDFSNMGFYCVTGCSRPRGGLAMEKGTSCVREEEGLTHSVQ